jgi:hypothetical protein
MERRRLGADVSNWAHLDVRTADLGGATLGVAAGRTLWLDANAAGRGWLHPTPWNDSEFITPGDQGERHRTDLLTTLAHAIGRLHGRQHVRDGVTIDTLATGIRRTSGSTEVNETFNPDLFGNSSDSLFTMNRASARS